MSIESSQSSQSTNQVQKPDASRNQAKADAPREPAPKENVDRFQQLLQSKQEAKDEFLSARRQGAGELLGEQRVGAEAAARQTATEDAVRGIHQQASRDGSSEQPQQQMVLDSAEVLAMMQAQGALRGHADVTQAAPPQVNANAFAEMVERHVRQLAVGGGNATGDDGQVLLRMADATLPGTDLLLSKTADGWLLRADVRSRGSYDAIREAAPELAKRFAERNLGTLEIDPQFHG